MIEFQMLFILITKNRIKLNINDDKHSYPSNTCARARTIFIVYKVVLIIMLCACVHVCVHLCMRKNIGQFESQFILIILITQGDFNDFTLLFWNSRCSHFVWHAWTMVLVIAHFDISFILCRTLKLRGAQFVRKNTQVSLCT